MRHTGWRLPASAAVVLGIVVPALGAEFRSIDGTGNNLFDPSLGSAGVQLLRLADPAYDDGASVPRGGDPSTLPSARAVSNAVVSQAGPIVNAKGASDWLWQWGQFIDHDLDLTGSADPLEPFNIAVPTGDPHFDPLSMGGEEIGLNRSLYDPATGTDSTNPRQQVNQITAYIDASMVYGSDAARAAALRTGSMGLLKTSIGDNGETLLPFNTDGLPNAGGTGSALYVAGDVRVNEQVGLTAAHTLFVREHNRIAADLRTRLEGGEAALVAKFNDSGLSQDEFLYQSARKVVGALIQKITYEEWLPVLLGVDFNYSGYDDGVDAGIANEFSTAAFRVGHTLLSPQLLRLNDDGTEAAAGHLNLQNAFFSPSQVTVNGVDSLIRGLAHGQAQEVDTQIVDDVRNFLFGPPGSGGFDLASLNLQRGRDHGLGSLNDVRIDLGLGAHADFLSLTGGDTALAAALGSVYGSVNDVDLWVGGLAETHLTGAMVGETFFTIISDQFLRLMLGDRFFYLDSEIMAHLLLLDPAFDSTLFSDVILRNSSITNMQSHVFLVNHAIPAPPALAAGIALLGMVGLRRRRRSAA